MLVRAVLGTVLGASIVACALLSPAAVVVPLLAVGLWVWFEMRHADSKRVVRAGHAVPGRRNGGQGPQPNDRGAPPDDNPRSDRRSPGPSRRDANANNANTARRQSPERRADVPANDNPPGRASGVVKAGTRQPPAPAPHRVPDQPHNPPPASVQRRADEPEIQPRWARRDSLEHQILAWQQADPQRRTPVYQRLRDNLRTQSRLLDLTPVAVSQLPNCVRRFGHLEEVRLRPQVLRHNQLTDGPMPQGGHALLDHGYVRENLRAWVFLSGATAEQAKLLERHFVKGSTHIDLRGLNLPSIPDVLASYPSLNSVSISTGLLERCQRLRTQRQLTTSSAGRERETSVPASPSTR